MKKVFGVLAFLSFFALLGIVGAIEQNMVGLAKGVMEGAIAMAALYLFTWLAGGFDAVDYTDYRQKENRRQEQHSHRR